MDVNDGPEINLWDGMAVVAWLVATGLIVADPFTDHGMGMGPLTPFGGLIALVAAVLTIAGIARRAKDEILRQMFEAFQAGRDSVSKFTR